MDEDKKAGFPKPGEMSRPDSIKGRQTGMAVEEGREKRILDEHHGANQKVVVTEQDLRKTLKILKRPPQFPGQYKNHRIFPEKPPKSFLEQQAHKTQKERERQDSMSSPDETRVDPHFFLREKIEKTPWEESSFLRKLESKGGIEEAKAAERIIQWAKQKGLHLNSGSGTKTGLLFPVIRMHKYYKNQIYRPISLWTNGAVKIELKKLQDPSFNKEKRLNLLQQLNKIPGVSIPEKDIYQEPKIKFSFLTNNDALNQFLSAIDWMINELKTNPPLKLDGFLFTQSQNR